MTTRDIEVGHAEGQTAIAGLNMHNAGEHTLSLPTRKPSKRSKIVRRSLPDLNKLRMTLEQTKQGRWIADDPETSQFGEGATPAEAVADLMSTLRGYLAALEARQYSLSPELAEHLCILRARTGAAG